MLTLEIRRILAEAGCGAGRRHRPCRDGPGAGGHRPAAGGARALPGPPRPAGAATLRGGGRDRRRCRRGRVAALARTLVGRHGYAATTSTYDDLQNANLMRVIDRKRGLPVALGILYIHAARRQGWTMRRPALSRPFPDPPGPRRRAASSSTRSMAGGPSRRRPARPAEAMTRRRRRAHAGPLCRRSATATSCCACRTTSSSACCGRDDAERRGAHGRRAHAADRPRRGRALARARRSSRHTSAISAPRSPPWSG